MSQNKSESSYIIKNCLFYDIRVMPFINESFYISPIHLLSSGLDVP